MPAASWAVFQEHCEQVKGGSSSSLFTTTVAHLQCCAQLWFPQYGKDADTLEWV